MQIYAPGTRIGPYEIVSRPMIGGMGVVYFCLDHANDGRPVAMKTFKPEFLPDRAARDRFLREGAAWVQLSNHPHIVRCYGVEYIDPTAFLVLELITKEKNMADASLRSWLVPGHPLPVEQVLLFALQIAYGLQYAAEKLPGFVHRDLKPENILVGADKLANTNVNRLRVTDFGLIKTVADIVTGASISISDANDLKLNQVQFTRGAGTPLYMAPEQWNGKPVGVFTDVYAFGCILYEMLSGQLTVDGKTISELQSAHCNGKLRTLPSELPYELRLFVNNCLAVNSLDRYQDWPAISKIIMQLLDTLTGLDPLTVSSLNKDVEVSVLDGWSFNSIGLAFLDLGNVQKAKYYFDQSLSFGERFSQDRLSAFALANLGNAYLALGDVPQAMNSLEKALSLDQRLGDQRGEISDLVSLGQCYLRLGDPRRAIMYCGKGLEALKENNDWHGMRITMGILGNAYITLGDFKRSIEYFVQALEIARRIHDRRGEASDLGSLGSAYFEIGENKKGIEFLESALTVCKEIGDRRAEGDTLGNLGIIYGSLKNFIESKKLLNQALEIHRETGNQASEANVLGNLGTVCRELGQVSEAFKCYEQRLKIEREIGNIRGVAFAAFNIAALLSALKEKENLALQLAQEAADLFEKTGNTEYANRAKMLAKAIREDSNKVLSPEEMFNAGIIAFLRVSSLSEMAEAARKYPIMVTTEFITGLQNIQKLIQSEDQPDFEKRLSWLSKIKNNHVNL